MRCLYCGKELVKAGFKNSFACLRPIKECPLWNLHRHGDLTVVELVIDDGPLWQVTLDKFLWAGWKEPA